ncbi:MAG: 30S ribosome-binding factor RbfA [Ilumatobacteraceae bacterium]
MTRSRRPRRPSSSSSTRVPRTARLGELLREVVAEELERRQDDRLDLVAITSVDVDAELNRAIVFFDSLRGEEADEEVLEALGEHRVRLQTIINRQIRARKTPILEFRPDEVLRSAERIDQILRDNPIPERPEVDDVDDELVDDDSDDDVDDELVDDELDDDELVDDELGGDGEA